MNVGGSTLSFTLKPAFAEDFDRLFQLRIEAMRESLERIGRYDEQRAFERFHSTYQAEHTRLIMIGDDFAGCIAMKPVEDSLLIEHFYLLPAFQGCGVGASVLEQLLAEADATQRSIRLSVLQQSDTGRFYRRFGFVETGQDEWDVYLERPGRTPIGQAR